MDKKTLKYLRFFTKETKVFGLREFWQCEICQVTGGDEPALKRSAQEMAEVHFENAALHFKQIGLIATKDEKRDSLLNWMREEMDIYGQMKAEDASVIASRIAHDFYASEIRERDVAIKDLIAELESMKEQVK